MCGKFERNRYQCCNLYTHTFTIVSYQRKKSKPPAALTLLDVNLRAQHETKLTPPPDFLKHVITNFF